MSKRTQKLTKERILRMIYVVISSISITSKILEKFLHIQEDTLFVIQILTNFISISFLPFNTLRINAQILLSWYFVQDKANIYRYLK